MMVSVVALLLSLQLFVFRLCPFVSAHGNTVVPPPRNAVDWDDGAAQGKTAFPVDGIACPAPHGSSLTGRAGQACYWFSNGCAIGCDECDGNSRGPIPNDPDDPAAWRRKFNLCNTTMRATICDPKLRTVNTKAECGAEDDWYYYSPWRAPGSAPVFDSCGMAGGRPATGGGFGATYAATAHAGQGDLGSRLKPAPTGTVWAAGSVVEVSWNTLANHGGGYQWRLCPASEPLTEECFFRTPLSFVGMQSFRWNAVNGKGGTRVWFNGTYVSEGTLPEGSTWAKNPLPRNDVGNTLDGFEPSCAEATRCDAYRRIGSGCLCSGEWGPYDVEVVDTVKLPNHLLPGDYVLGWRWDCEESNQIWQSCSDVTIVAAAEEEEKEETTKSLRVV